MCYIADAWLRDPEGNCKRITKEFDTQEQALMWARGFRDVDIYHS